MHASELSVLGRSVLRTRATAEGAPAGSAGEKPAAATVDGRAARKRAALLAFPQIELCHIEFTPEHLKTPYITHAYRVGLSWRECMHSLFALHNETLNVWTHLLGAFLFVAAGVHAFTVLLPSFRVQLSDHFMFAAYLATAISCMALSATFHLLAPISVRAYELLYRLDLLGICLLIAGSYIPGLYYGFQCIPSAQRLYIVVAVLAIGTATVVAVHPRFQPKQYKPLRTGAMAAVVVASVVPASHWIMVADVQFLWLMLPRLFVMLGLYAIGFVFWVARVPERWSPGRFNVWLHSHQWWHLCVLLAALVWYLQLVAFVEWQQLQLQALEAGAAAIANATGLAGSAEADRMQSLMTELCAKVITLAG